MDLHTDENEFENNSKPFDCMFVFWHSIHSTGLNL